MHRIPTGKTPEPEGTAPIYGTYGNVEQNAGADKDVENAAWGDNEMETDVTIVDGLGRSK